LDATFSLDADFFLARFFSLEIKKDPLDEEMDLASGEAFFGIQIYLLLVL
jgi:hypothetical protein